MRRDYTELKEVFLDDNRKTRLKEMKQPKRWLVTSWWLLKALFLKLKPARRLLLILAAVIMLMPNTVQYSGDRLRVSTETSSIAVAILLFILMLELKDKLLAHDELEAGRAVQTALMPEQTPEIPGWSAWLFTRTANEVGGDLVDLQALDATRFRVSLADVAGKGLKAALFTAKLQATLRALAPDVPTMGELAAKLNRIFYRDSLRNSFASLVCIELNTGDGMIRIVNAGHPPPLHVRGGAILETKKGDPAIGIVPEFSYSEHQVLLETGEVLLIYSDGLTEAKNEQGQFFGVQRLMDILPRLSNSDARNIGELLVQDVDRFVGEAKVYDDLSLVVLRRKS
jgi:serine phosphatase RsbU (regulator of sigma subunit)